MSKEVEYEDLDDPIDNSDLGDRGDDFESDEDDEIEEDEDSPVEDEEEDEEDPVDEEEEEEVIEEKIPRSRLNQVIRQREEARERTAWLEAQLEKLISNQTKEEPKAVEVPKYDFARAEEEYITLILEGDVAKASALRKEINAAQQLETKALINEIKNSASVEAKKESSSLLLEDKFNSLVETYETKYPFLDTSSKDYNEEAVDTVNTLLAGYVAAGKSKFEGLQLAIKKVAPLYTKDEVVPTKPSLGNKRKVEAGKKAAQAANSQPTKTKSVSTKAVDRETVNVTKMSDRDFAKLTDSEKRILRGD